MATEQVDVRLSRLLEQIDEAVKQTKKDLNEGVEEGSDVKSLPDGTYSYSVGVSEEIPPGAGAQTVVTLSIRTA